MNTPAMNKNARLLDDFDHQILSLVQRDNQRTHAELGEEVGLSTSAVRRRIQQMRRDGTIVNEVALLDPDRFGVTLVVELAFVNETREASRNLDRKLASLPNVQQSYQVAGDADYLLVVHGPSLKWYEGWAGEHFTDDPNIKRLNTTVVWSRKKFEPSIQTAR